MAYGFNADKSKVSVMRNSECRNVIVPTSVTGLSNTLYIKVAKTVINEGSGGTLVEFEAEFPGRLGNKELIPLDSLQTYFPELYEIAEHAGNWDTVLGYAFAQKHSGGLTIPKVGYVGCGGIEDGGLFVVMGDIDSTASMVSMYGRFWI